MSVDFRNDLHSDLTGASLAGFHNHFGLGVVALVDGESPAAILLDGEFLRDIAQFVGSAVAVSAAAVLVVQFNDGDGVDIDGLDAVPLVVLIGNEGSDSVTGKGLIDLLGEFGSEIVSSHIVTFPF